MQTFIREAFIYTGDTADVAYYAFCIGRHMAWRDECLRRARSTDRSDLRAHEIECARRWHREAMSEARRLRSCRF